MVNQPTGPVVSEGMSEKPLDSLQNLDGEDLKLDGGGMYPTFKTPEGEKKVDNNEEEVKLSESVLEKNSENPVTPILKRINGINGIHIGDKDFQKIYDNLGKINNNDDVISKIIGAIDSSHLDKKVSKILNTILLEIGKNNDNRFKENKDGEVERPKEFKGNKLLENDKYKNIVDLLAKNYISFPDGDLGEGNFEKDLQLSIETTVNKIISTDKNIPQSLGLDKAKKDIMSGNLELQLDALNYIFLLVNTNEGQEGKASNLLYKKIKQKENGEKKSLQERFTDFQKTSKEALNSKNIEELQKLLEEIRPMEEEAKSNGDIFIASDLEKIQGEIDTVLKENDPLSSI